MSIKPHNSVVVENETPDATEYIDIASLKADHEAAKKDEATADNNVKDALKQKQMATDEKTKAHTRQQRCSASQLIPENLILMQKLTAVWKQTVKVEKEATAACKTARERVKQMETTRKKAWDVLEKARQDANTRDARACTKRVDAFENNYKTYISAPRQAIEGLKAWNGCPGVTVVQLPLAKLPALDGHEVKAIDGSVCPCTPLLFGTTVLCAGTGGKKTVVTNDFLQQPVSPKLKDELKDGAGPVRINADLPLVFVTARINMAHKTEADLAKRGIIDVRNYKNKPEATSMEDWLNYKRIIISIEQLKLIAPWASLYRLGIIVMDECVTCASSLVNGVTVTKPAETTGTLRTLVDSSAYFIAMDADFDADGKGKALLKGIAGKKKVLCLQTTKPSLTTTVVYAYAGIPEHKIAFEERMEISCRKSAEYRLNGEGGNRTYIGEDWPNDVKKTCQQLREWGVTVKGLHGNLGAGVRKEALKDMDKFVDAVDALVVTSVAGIGTDQNCKYSAAFLRLKSGDSAPGATAAGQRVGRVNRNSECPLDLVTAPDGSIYAGGVVYVLLPGLPPNLGGGGIDSSPDPMDRAEKKFHSMRSQVSTRRGAVSQTQLDAEQRFEPNNGTFLQQGGRAGYRRLQVCTLGSGDSPDQELLAELEAWQDVSADDKRCCKELNSYAIKFFEILALPNRSFPLAPIQQLSEEERKELMSLRNGTKKCSQIMTNDEVVGEMSTVEQYTYVKEQIEKIGDLEPSSRFWSNCYGKCGKDTARHEGNNIDELYITVWGGCLQTTAERF